MKRITCYLVIIFATLPLTNIIFHFCYFEPPLKQTLIVNHKAGTEWVYSHNLTFFIHREPFFLPRAFFILLTRKTTILSFVRRVFLKVFCFVLFVLQIKYIYIIRLNLEIKICLDIMKNKVVLWLFSMGLIIKDFLFNKLLFLLIIRKKLLYSCSPFYIC